MRFFQGISIRLLLFNVLLVFLPAAGFLYLDVYERELLEAQERAMVQQGRHLAAALSEQGELDRELAGGLLDRLDRRTEARLRIVGQDGALLADSATLGPRREPAPAASSREASEYSDALPPEAREKLAYRIGAWLFKLPRRLSTWLGAPQPSSDPEGAYRPLEAREVRAALAGRYGAATRKSRGGQRSLTLYSAIPVRNQGQVVGAVVVSQSTFRILSALYEVRLGIFRVILASVAAAVVLSLLVSTTIARPLRQLRNEAAALLDRRGRLRGRFRGSRRGDEIGDLARALEELTRRLEAHLAFIESFASDVSHELKNPLAAVRGATELLAEVEDPADRQRFLAMVQKEVARMEGLLSGLREITEIDAQLESEKTRTVALDGLLREIVEGRCLRADNPLEIKLEAPSEPVLVQASPERLTQVFENLLDNAASFSPAGGTVEVRLTRENGTGLVLVDDRGPGIPETHLDRIFDRFFRYRPDESGSRNGHTGLGLSIVKAIVDGYGGSITARNRPEGGARFEVRLPALS
ncbi:MAG TPA: stimulus-sensing domain-containing protein [Thermoanaerobaculia bacterium]|nr:stimulus-sensing domain-containing protein [Thermoanaerobaculia bacterium]